MSVDDEPEATAIPDWLRGAWVRAGRSIANGPPGECSDVVWLQVGPWFADVRLPRPGRAAGHAFDEAHAFSGLLEVLTPGDDGTRVAWHHDLDSAVHSGDPDTAVVAVRDGMLVESGQGYVEWWARPDATVDHPPLVLDWRPVPVVDGGPVGARVVCTAGMAVTVWSGPTAGGAWCGAATDWQPARVVGVPPPGLDIARALGAGLSGVPLPAGWHRKEAP